ncbi:MAG: hypothetical protein ABI353_02185 [Isosphaeraceae bacterium]
MDLSAHIDGDGPPFDSPDTLLNALRDHPDWDESRREALFDRLIGRFPRALVIAAVRSRLGDLSGADAEATLRVVEAEDAPDLFQTLADAVRNQPNLPPERAREALALLQGVGLLDHDPALAERWTNLNEAIDDSGSLAELAAQLDEGPDAAWIALQGLEAIEPSVRAEIVAGLADQPVSPGLIAFLRMLAFTHEPTTRAAALDALERLPGEHPGVADAWAEIAVDHPEAEVAGRARNWLGCAAGTSLDRVMQPDRDGPRLRRSLVTALDGQGRGTIVLVAEDGGAWTASAFLCDVFDGVREAVGRIGRDRDDAEAFLAEFASQPDRDAVADVPELAIGLLAGSLMLCGPESSPALRFWLERTVGPGFRPGPFPGSPGLDDGEVAPSARAAEPARDVLDACTDWLDDSDLTYDLAEELLLRDGGAAPDPVRDSGAFRYLFEHRLQGRLELYRRMLLWMASFWRSSQAPELSNAARMLAAQLADPQFDVPGHPFIVALIRRNLERAQADLRQGIDLRDPRTRARQARLDWP